MKGKIIYLILILAFIFRFVSLTHFPVGFNADEASFGYDAYSILKTGKDQWGNTLPLYLKSFGDYKSPLYSYLTIPFVAVFGLTEFAVRIPNVIVGTLAVFIAYLLGKKLFDKKIGFMAAFLLAVNPWSIMIGRGALEFNLLTFFIPLAVYLFLNKKYVWGALSFGLAFFSYHSALVISPLVFAGLIYILKENLKKMLPAIGLFAVFLGLTIYTSTGAGGARINERSITQGALEEGAKAKIELINQGINPTVAKLEHNKYQVVAQRFINNYFQYFSYEFLFTGGAGESYYGMVPGIGVIYIFEGLLLLGLIPFSLKEKKKRGTVLALLIWLLISPLAAALSTGVGYSGSRASGMLPVLQILEAVGFLGWVPLFKGRYLKPFYAFSVAIVIFSIFSFCKVYFKTPSLATQKQMLTGNIDAANWLKDNAGNKNVLISRSFSEPQIFIAFANRWDPTDYQKATKNWNLKTWVDQIPEYSLGDYIFTSDKLENVPNTLLVGRPDDFSNGVTPIKIFKYSDGSDALYIIDPGKTLYAEAF